MLIIELKDTIELMNSVNYEDRFKAEYYQLKIRIEKLFIMLDKYKRGELNFTPKCSYEMLSSQLNSMCIYLSCLEDRATIEDINLNNI